MVLPDETVNSSASEFHAPSPGVVPSEKTSVCAAAPSSVTGLCTTAPVSPDIVIADVAFSAMSVTSVTVIRLSAPGTGVLCPITFVVKLAAMTAEHPKPTISAASNRWCTERNPVCCCVRKEPNTAAPSPRRGRRRRRGRPMSVLVAAIRGRRRRKGRCNWPDPALTSTPSAWAASVLAASSARSVSAQPSTGNNAPCALLEHPGRRPDSSGASPQWDSVPDGRCREALIPVRGSTEPGTTRGCRRLPTNGAE